MADEQALLEHYMALSGGHDMGKMQEAVDAVDGLVPSWVTSLSKMCPVDGEPGRALPYFDIRWARVSLSHNRTRQAYIQHSVDLAIDIRATHGAAATEEPQICCVGTNLGASMILSKRRYPAATVLGVELVPVFVELANRRLATQGLKVVEGNLLKLPEVTRQKWDIILDEVSALLPPPLSPATLELFAGSLRLLLLAPLVIVSHLRGETDDLIAAAKALKQSLTPTGCVITSGLVRAHELEEIKSIFAEHGLNMTMTKDISEECVLGGEIALPILDAQDQPNYPQFVARFTKNYVKLLKKVNEEKSMRVMVVGFEHGV